MIHKAKTEDVQKVVKIYEEILEKQSEGSECIGWIKGVYPTERTALEALEKGELFVLEEDGTVLAAAKINQEQMPAYREAKWEWAAADEEVMVLHTLVVSPDAAGKGFGTKFVRFYEEYALQQGCRYLRMDTNEINTKARRLYKKMGYKEVGIIPCTFNGIENVHLVCLEKKLAN